MRSWFVASLAALWLLAGCTTVETGARRADEAIGKAVGWLTGEDRQTSTGDALLGAPSPPPPLEPAGGTFRTRSDLRLRVGPGTNYRVVGVLPAGSSVVVLGRVRGRDWVKVRTAAGAGYLARAYLEAVAEGGGEDRLPVPVDGEPENP